jgi:hypothetical protein
MKTEESPAQERDSLGEDLKLAADSGTALEASTTFATAHDNLHTFSFQSAVVHINTVYLTSATRSLYRAPPALRAPLSYNVDLARSKCQSHPDHLRKSFLLEVSELLLRQL